MPPLYIGRGGSPGGPGFGGPISRGPLGYGPGTGGMVGSPITPLPGVDPSKILNGAPSKFPSNPGGTPPTSPNVLGAQSVRASGPSQGFDPSYLQNLTTAIGGLFSRPNGNLSFNPLGDLSSISPTTGFGNAPVPGVPSTLLQDAINGLAFLFSPQATSSGTTGGSTVSSGSGYTGGAGGRNSPY